MDDLTPEQRRRSMQANRGRNTRPELLLRQALRAAGLRGYRLHRSDIPGSPDVAFLRWRVAVFVDGEFWHGGRKWKPETASEFWVAKIQRNVERDRQVEAQLQNMGWTVLRFWDREVITNAQECAAAIASALQHARSTNA